MKKIAQNKNVIFLNSFLALSFFLNASTYRVLANEKAIEKSKEVVTEESSNKTEQVLKDEATVEEKQTVKDQEKSKSLEKLKESFIKFDLSTAFGTIPSITLALSKQTLKIDPVPVITPPVESIEKEEGASENTIDKDKTKTKSPTDKKKLPRDKAKAKNRDKKENKEANSPEEPIEEVNPLDLIKAKQDAFNTRKNRKLARTFVYLGYSFLLDTNADAAKNCFLTATILNPESLIAKCYLAHSLGKLCKFSEQKELLDQLKTVEEKTAFVYFTLAKNELRIKNAKEALRLIELGLSIPEEKNDCKYKLLILKAKAYAHLGMGKLTIEAYKNAAKETENDYVEQILLANSKLIEGDLKGSKEFILNASKILPDDPIWQYKLGNYYASENNSTKAIEYLLASTVTKRLSTTAYFNLANQYAYNNKFKNALEAIHHVQKLVPYSATAFATEGDIYKLSGNVRSAIESYDEALKIDPAAARVYYEIAYLYSISKRKDRAVKTFQTAIEIMPVYWRVRFNFAEILWKLKLYDQAKMECLKGIDLLSEPPSELNILARHYLSRAHAMLGYLENKKKNSKRTIEEAVLFNELKYLPDLPQALRYVKLRPERLVFSEDLSPKDPSVQAALGDMFYELKDYKTSEKHYREAIKLSPDDADLHSYLLNVLTHKNDWAGAAQENLIYSGKVVNRLPGKLGEWLSPKDKE